MKLPTEKSEVVTDISGYTYFIYGPPKVGKTTLCSGFDSALFIATEPGHKFQKVYKIDPMNWLELKAGAGELITDKNHKYKNVIFDTVDNAYKMCESYICKEHGILHPSDLTYGKGFTLVKNEFERVIIGLAQKGFGIVFVSHAQTNDKEVKNITRSYTDSTLSGSARKVISGMCDFILYCYTDDDGNRLMRTKGTPNVNAGDRSDRLPEIMPLSYKELESALVKKNKQTNK